MIFSNVKMKALSKKELINGGTHFIDKPHKRIISRTNSFFKKDRNNTTPDWRPQNKSNVTLEYSTKLYSNEGSSNKSFHTLLDITQRKALARKMLMYIKQSPANVRLQIPTNLPPLSFSKATHANLFLRRALNENSKPYNPRLHLKPMCKGSHLIIHIPQLSAEH